MRRWTYCAAALIAVGCSWARFDDLEENASVLVLKQPSGLTGFGASVTAAADGNRVLVLVAGGAKGSNGAALFELGQAQDPSLDAFDIGQCTTNECVLGRSVAALPIANSPSGLSKSACWVTGFQKQPVGGPALSVACTEAAQQRFIYALPLGVVANPDTDELNLAGESLPKVGTPPVATALVVGIPKVNDTANGAAVAYPASTTTPIPLVPSLNSERYGAAVAVLRDKTQHRFLVGAPDSDTLWVFDAAGFETGCLKGPARFSRTLATGDVDGDGTDDVVVAAETDVLVIRGSAITALNQPGSCVTVGAAETLVTLSCRSSGDVGGCPGGFGDALAVGDIDGNGDGEVAVGVPRASVRGAGSAGAVLIFDVKKDSEHPEFVTEERFIAAAESGDRLGAALTFAPQKGRHLLVAGAPGAGKVAIFYCSRLIPSDRRGKRCK